MTSFYNNSTERSEALSAYIRDEMHKTNNAMPFAAFMELVLFHPDWGYYNADTFELGEHGDFTTAPEISPLFAKCLARQIQQIHQQEKLDSILELGAGSGKLAYDLLTGLEASGCLPHTYFIYEPSQSLRKKQQTLLQSTPLSSRIIWLDTLPENFSGTIIANEVLDVLPVNCYRVEKNSVREKCVTYTRQGFAWELHDCANREPEVLRERYALPDGYEFEINFQLRPFIEGLSRSLKKGVILFSDYGYGQPEYYHPERSKGTLTCFYQHSKNDNPLIRPGLQDITTHVDFTRVIDYASDCGLSLAGYTTQAAFLLATGLTGFVTELEENLDEAETFNLHHAVKVLTLPMEMGERIKFMALSRNVEIKLQGFSLQDRRREL